MQQKHFHYYWLHEIFIVNTYIIFFIHEFFMNGQSLVGGLEKNSLSLFTVIEKMYQETTNSSPLLSNNYHRIYKYFSILTSYILEISRMNSLVNTSQVLLNELCKAFFKKVSPKETKDRKAPLSHFPLFKQLNSTDNQ